MKKFFKSRFNLRSIIAIITVISILMSVVYIGTFASFAADTIADVDGDYMYLEVTAKSGQTKGFNIQKSIKNSVLGLEKGKSYRMSISVRGSSLGGNIYLDIYKSTTINSTNKIDGKKINLNTDYSDWNTLTSEVLTVTSEFVEANLGLWVNKTGATSDTVLYIDALTLEEYNTTTNSPVANTKKNIDLSLLVGENDGTSVKLIDNTPPADDAIADVDGDYKYLKVTAKKGQTKGFNIQKSIKNSVLGLEKGKSYRMSISVRGSSLGGNIYLDIYKSTTINSTNKIDGKKINLNTDYSDWNTLTSEVLTVTSEFVEANLGLWVNKTGATSDTVLYIDALTLEEYNTTTNSVVANTKKNIDLSLLVGENDGTSVKLIDNTPIEAGKDTSADQNGDYKWLNVTANAGKKGSASATLTNEQLGLVSGKSYVFSLYIKGDKIANGNFWFETYNSGGDPTDKVQIDLNGGAWGEWTPIESVGSSASSDKYLKMDETVKGAIYVNNTNGSDAVVNIDAITVAEYDVSAGKIVEGSEKAFDLAALVKTTDDTLKTELIDKNPAPTPTPTPTPTPVEPGKDTSADQNGDSVWLNVTAYGKGNDDTNKGGSVSAIITNDSLGLEKGKYYTFSLYAKGDKLTNGNLWFETYNSGGESTDDVEATDKVQLNLNGGAWGEWTKITCQGSDNILKMDETVKGAIWVKNTTETDAVINIDTLVYSECDSQGNVIEGTEKAIPLNKFINLKAVYGKTELIDKTPEDLKPKPEVAEPGKDTSADQNGDSVWLNVTVYGKGNDDTNKGGSVSAIITNDSLGLEKGKYYIISLYAKGDKLTNGNLWFETYNSDGTATDKVQVNLNGGAWGEWTKITCEGGDKILKMDETVKGAIWVKNTTETDAVINIDTLVYSECDSQGNVIEGTEKAIPLNKLINLKAVYGKTELIDKRPPAEPGKDTDSDYDKDDEWLNIIAYSNKDGTVSSTVTDVILPLKKGKAYVFSLYAKGDKITNANMWIETYNSESKATDKVQLNLNGGAWRDWTLIESSASNEKFNNNYLVMDEKVKAAIWVKNTSNEEAVINIDAFTYAEYDITTGKVVEGTEKVVKLFNFANISLDAGKAEYKTKAPITYCKIDNLNFSRFNSVNNAVMKAQGYKNNSAMYFSLSKKDELAWVSTKLNNLDNGVYTVTAYVKSSGGFAAGHIYANSGMEYTASVKEKNTEWKMVEIPFVEVKDGKLTIGVWLKAAEKGQYLWVDNIQLKLQGEDTGMTNTYYTDIINVKNTDLSTNANTIVSAGGYKNSTKISLTGESDFKGINSYKLKGLEAGTYTITAFVRSSGGHVSSHLFANTGADSSTQITAVFPKWKIDDWTEVVLSGVEVSAKGELLIGFWINTKAGNWLEIDYVQVKRERYGEGTDTYAPENSTPTVNTTPSGEGNKGSSSNANLNDGKDNGINLVVTIVIIVAAVVVLAAATVVGLVVYKRKKANFSKK